MTIPERELSAQGASYRLAAVQMNSSDQPEQNIVAVGEWIDQAVARGAKLVALPEMWLCIGRREAMTRAVQGKASHKALQFLQEKASQHRVWIVAGSVPWLRDGSPDARPVSRCFVLDDSGSVVGHYDKIHLFDVQVNDNKREYRESDHYCAGEKVVVLPTPLGKLGLAICYDLRFPELFRCMWQMGAEVVFLPSAFTEITGRAHWRSLIEARAIENCCYFVAPNQVGKHADARLTWGHSMIVSPWGEEMDMCAEGEGLVIADIDLARIQAIKQRMPCHLHQKINL